MRWFVLALVFAGLITLAVGTAAIKAKNRKMRRTLGILQSEVMALDMELARLRLRSQQDAAPNVLADRWRQALQGAPQVRQRHPQTGLE